jgi:hypothetical protein
MSVVICHKVSGYSKQPDATHQDGAAANASMLSIVHQDTMIVACAFRWNEVGWRQSTRWAAFCPMLQVHVI